jgi:hypothetical protein
MRFFPSLTIRPLKKIAIDPLLHHFRTRHIYHWFHFTRYPPVGLVLSRRILTHFNTPAATPETATWRQTLISDPPVDCLNLEIETYQCVTQKWKRECKHTEYLHNPHGITFDDLITALRSSKLPHNLGLVPDDHRCKGYVNQLGNHKVCACYNMVKKLEDAFIGAEAVRKKRGEKRLVNEKNRMKWDATLRSRLGVEAET